ncbi:MAG: von Willebrand factor type domain protein [Verrucomicrobiaceae bacterium]|nr:von Willebrand factor type domain protein [Verrucomicrobiaceae bacterium]
MDWESPKLLLLALPLLALLLWIESRSAHPMEGLRKRLLLALRGIGVLLALLALAGPARVVMTGRKAVVLVLDHSQSLGAEGLAKVYARARELKAGLPSNVECFTVALGDEAGILPGGGLEPGTDSSEWQRAHGGQTHLQRGVEFARALFPAGTARHIVLITDGQETRGSLMEAARDASVAGIRLHAIAVAGPRKPDVRVRELVPSRSRIHEGATLRLTAGLESTMNGAGRLKLYENGIEVESRDVSLKEGESRDEIFTRTPSVRNIYKYRAVLEGIAGDSLPANNDALTIVDVRGRLRLLYAEGEPAEAQYLLRAMEKEGIQLELRQPGSIPQTLEELAGYDGIILSDISARQVGENAMSAMHDYVDKLGGGLIMIGGPNSFGVGGYYRTPIEEILPVRLKSPDDEEKQSAALALVIDRSGSMAGEKLETAKSASVAAAEVLGRNDSIGVTAFDSEAHIVAPMTRVTSISAIAGQIASLAAGGGTNMEPAIKIARESLQRVKARIKHMIILTDGQTSGSGYEATAAQCRAEGITISTIAIGEGSFIGLLQAIASAGGGQAYTTTDAQSITRIFTQDTLLHTGRMIREEPFEAKAMENHVMLAGLTPFNAPALLGYVKTLRKTTAQVPLVTDTGDPLLAHWRYGLGKVTAFTSDAKSRWAGLWLGRWPGYGRFWSQVLRETSRPPQGQRMDLRTTMQGDEAVLSVDMLEDAGARVNAATVYASVFFVAVDTLGAPLKPVAQVLLQQTGPGLYEGRFRPEQPGVYMVRAQSGADTVSAGLVHNPGAEASLGTVNQPLLKAATAITGGEMLAAGQVPDLAASQATQFTELWPPLVVVLLLVFLLDVLVRRWEHVTGLWETVRHRA